MIRPLTLLSIVAAAGAGLHVYNTKHAVSLLGRELRAIAQDIQEAETRTQALQAEWSWATEQERLRALAQRHLAGLEPMQPAQFLRFAEAERRLPPPAADDGSSALFAPGAEQARLPAGTRIALLPPEAPGGAAPPMPMVAAASRPAPADALAAVARAALAAARANEALPLPAPAAPEMRQVARNPIVFAPRPAEPRAPEPRPSAVEMARAAPPPPRPAAPPAAAQRPTIVASAAAAVPVARPPAPQPQLAFAPAAPRTAAAAPAAAPAQVAVAARASEGATALGSFGPGLGGGSTLGSARAALPPPVAFGLAGAALR